MSVTRALAACAADARFEDLPAEVVAHSKVAILNILGAAIAGTQTRIGRIHGELARSGGGGISEATLYGSEARVSVPMAAYANASLAFALDYEDVVCYCIHAGPVTIPAALAVAEALRSSGRQLILAIERGFEVGTRIGLAMQPSAERGAKVWGQQYTPFAPCIAAGVLLGLNAEQMDSAMGIAGTYAPVPSAYKYFGVVKETRPMREAKLGWGWMAHGGTFAALSAEAGLGGGYGILDGDEGFWIMAGSDRCDHQVMVERLGETHYLLETEFKVHPSIAWNHAPHVALKRLMAAEGFRAAEVSRVHIRGLGAERIADYAPVGAVDAMFSLPYTVATTLLGDALLPAMYEESRIHSTEVRDTIAKVSIEADAEAERAWFEEGRMCFAIDVTLNDGRALHVDTEFPRDKPDIGRAEIEAKFRELAGVVYAPERVQRIIDAVDNLELCEDAGELARLLGA